MSLYSLALTIHILSAILGIGPIFVLPVITGRLRTLGTEAPTLVNMLNRISRFPRTGMPLLVLSGITMGVLHPYLWAYTWLRLALSLVVLYFVVGAGVAGRISRKLETLLPAAADGAGRADFAAVARRLHTWQLVDSAIALGILLLMITKPF